MGISRNIIIFIKENKISVPEISKSTGISENKLSDIKTVFTAEELLEICNFLNVQPNQFV